MEDLRSNNKKKNNSLLNENLFEGHLSKVQLILSKRYEILLWIIVLLVMCFPKYISMYINWWMDNIIM